MPKLVDSRLRKVLKKTAAPQTGWLDVFPAVIGRANGTVQTGVPGIIYIRNLLNGQVLTVYNFIVPNTAGLQVEVGRKVETPGLWQVKGVREAYSIPAGGSVGVGSHTHNDLFVTRDRVLPFIVFPLDGGEFTVQIIGDVFRNALGTATAIVNQTLDLASYVPTTGAKWVVIEADEDGAVHVKEGDEVDAKELLTLAYIPAPTIGRVESCAIRLYAGQAQLYRDPASINDFVDLRGLRTWGESASYGGGGPVSWGDIGGTLADQTDLQSALDAKASASALTDHINDTDDAHDASAISIVDSGGYFSGTDVEGALQELGEAAGGWIPVTETWTRTGNHTFTVSGDLTAKYRKGTKVRYRDGGSDEYGVVGSSSHSGGTTTVTLITNSDYAMAAATITNTYLSYIENPEGFPGIFNFALSVSSGITIGDATVEATWQATRNRLSVAGRIVFGSTTSISGDVVLDLPIAGIVPPNRNLMNIGFTTLRDASPVTTYNGSAMLGSSSTVIVRVFRSSGTYVDLAVLSSTSPFTWTTNDSILFNYNYLF